MPLTLAMVSLYFVARNRLNSWSSFNKLTKIPCVSGHLLAVIPNHTTLISKSQTVGALAQPSHRLYCTRPVESGVAKQDLGGLQERKYRQVGAQSLRPYLAAKFLGIFVARIVLKC